MVLGTICAMANGTSLPAVMIIFGEMTDSFIDAGMSLVNVTADFPLEDGTTMEQCYG